MENHLLSIISVLCYLSGTCVYAAFALKQSSSVPRYAQYLVTLGVVSHLFSLLELLSRDLTSGVFPLMLSIVGLCVVIVFVLGERRLGLGALSSFVLPVGIFFVLASSVVYHIERDTSYLTGVSSMLWLHLSAALLAYVFFALSFALSLALLVSERLLRRKQIRFSFRMPSLQLLDGLNAKSLMIGVSALGLGILTGLLNAEFSEISLLRDPRLLTSLGLIFLYSFTLGARIILRFKGAKTAWLSVLGFILFLSSSILLNFSGRSFHVY